MSKDKSRVEALSMASMLGYINSVKNVEMAREMFLPLCWINHHLVKVIQRSVGLVVNIFSESILHCDLQDPLVMVCVSFTSPMK